MIQGDCGAYATEPFTFTAPSTRIISPQIADSRLVCVPQGVSLPTLTSAPRSTHLARTHAAPNAHELAFAQREVDAFEYCLRRVTVPAELAILDHKRLQDSSVNHTWSRVYREQTDLVAEPKRLLVDDARVLLELLRCEEFGDPANRHDAL
jgi:hypothetical protein